MQDFRRIEAWQLARQFAIEVYRVSARFPIEERFGLTKQLRSSTLAIGAAIAEAFGRSTRRDTARVLQTAISEGNETLNHLLSAADLGYITPEELNALVEQLEPIRRKVFNLTMTIRPQRGALRRRR